MTAHFCPLTEGHDFRWDLCSRLVLWQSARPALQPRSFCLTQRPPGATHTTKPRRYSFPRTRLLAVYALDSPKCSNDGPVHVVPSHVCCRVRARRAANRLEESHGRKALEGSHACLPVTRFPCANRGRILSKQYQHTAEGTAGTPGPCVHLLCLKLSGLHKKEKIKDTAFSRRSTRVLWYSHICANKK